MGLLYIIYTYIYTHIYIYICVIGGLEHEFYFSIQLGRIIIPTEELIFFRGVGMPLTSILLYSQLEIFILEHMWTVSFKPLVDVGHFGLICDIPVICGDWSITIWKSPSQPIQSNMREYDIVLTLLLYLCVVVICGYSGFKSNQKLLRVSSTW